MACRNMLAKVQMSALKPFSGYGTASFMVSVRPRTK